MTNDQLHIKEIPPVGTRCYIDMSFSPADPSFEEGEIKYVGEKYVIVKLESPEFGEQAIHKENAKIIPISHVDKFARILFHEFGIKQSTAIVIALRLTSEGLSYINTGSGD